LNKRGDVYRLADTQVQKRTICGGTSLCRKDKRYWVLQEPKDKETTASVGQVTPAVKMVKTPGKETRFGRKATPCAVQSPGHPKWFRRNINTLAGNAVVGKSKGFGGDKEKKTAHLRFANREHRPRTPSGKDMTARPDEKDSYFEINSRYL